MIKPCIPIITNNRNGEHTCGGEKRSSISQTATDKVVTILLMDYTLWTPIAQPPHDLLGCCMHWNMHKTNQIWRFGQPKQQPSLPCLLVVQVVCSYLHAWFYMAKRDFFSSTYLQLAWCLPKFIIKNYHSFM